MKDNPTCVKYTKLKWITKTLQSSSRINLQILRIWCILGLSVNSFDLSIRTSSLRELCLCDLSSRLTWYFWEFRDDIKESAVFFLGAISSFRLSINYKIVLILPLVSWNISTVIVFLALSGISCQYNDYSTQKWHAPKLLLFQCCYFVYYKEGKWTIWQIHTHFRVCMKMKALAHS